MAHINVTLPNERERQDRLYWAKIEAELAFWKKETERLTNELCNISEAVSTWGYVEIEGRRLVEAPAPTNEPRP